MKHVFKPCGLDFKSFNKNAKQPSLKLNFSAMPIANVLHINLNMEFGTIYYTIIKRLDNYFSDFSA